jgi:hypothetical protein
LRMACALRLWKKQSASPEMITPGLISIVIPCYNSSAWIAATLESVFAQTDVPFDVVVVDDGSSDQSADLVAAEFPAVHLYRTHNGGPSAARNYGTERSIGEFIQYLDADDLFAPGKLRKQLDAIQASNADVAYGGWLKFVVLPDGTRNITERLERQLGPSPEIDLFTGFWCPPAAYLLRRSIVDRVGGWHKNLPVIQDARFMLDCALHGARFVCCAGIMAEYRVHETGSVSTRSRTAFLNDCLRNALEVRDWWASRGQLDAAHTQAVIEVFDMVANASVDGNAGLFDRACQEIAVLNPGYSRAWPAKKRTAVALFGYRSAISGAHYVRRCKSAVTGSAQRG